MTENRYQAGAPEPRPPYRGIGDLSSHTGRCGEPLRWYSLPVLLASLMLMAGLASCDSRVLGEKPGSGNGRIFDLVWEDLDRNYSYFELKEVDWDSVRTADRPLALAAGNDFELFQVLSGMLDDLRDGHVNLFAGKDRIYGYRGWHENYPVNYIRDHTRSYIEILDARNLFFGSVKGSNIGYVYLPTFSGDTDPGRHLQALLEKHGALDALVIDVRNNGGGSDLNSRKIAGFFAETSRIYAHYRYKSGPGHDEFEPWRDKVLDPSGTYSWNKPVALLTNRGCFSSCEDFVLAMRIQPIVTVVGDTTGGGSGNPVSRELPNGWTYRFSTWQQVTPGFTQYEGRGLYPDIPVWNDTQQEEENGTDAILERAVEYLNTLIEGESPPR